MTLTLKNLRRVCGHVVERATLARDLLAPAAGKLSGDDQANLLHSRCILAQYLGPFPEQDDDDDDVVRADLAPFGAIEVIALCRDLGMAVIVFREEASVAKAFWRQEETSTGVYSAVPPPHLALSTRFIHPTRIKVVLYPPSASTTEESVSLTTEESVSVSAEASTKPTRTEPISTGPTTDDATGMAANITQATPLWMESRPAAVFQDYPSAREGPGTTWFVPSRKSRVHGPTQGADGHLWMDGNNVTCNEKGVEIRQVSIRVVEVPQLLYQYPTEEVDLSVERTQPISWRSSLNPN